MEQMKWNTKKLHWMRKNQQWHQLPVETTIADRRKAGQKSPQAFGQRLHGTPRKPIPRKPDSFSHFDFDDIINNKQCVSSFLSLAKKLKYYKITALIFDLHQHHIPLGCRVELLCNNVHFFHQESSSNM